MRKLKSLATLALFLFVPSSAWAGLFSYTKIVLSAGTAASGNVSPMTPTDSYSPPTWFSDVGQSKHGGAQSSYGGIFFLSPDDGISLNSAQNAQATAKVTANFGQLRETVTSSATRELSFYSFNNGPLIPNPYGASANSQAEGDYREQITITSKTATAGSPVDVLFTHHVFLRVDAHSNFPGQLGLGAAVARDSYYLRGGGANYSFDHTIGTPQSDYDYLDTTLVHTFVGAIVGVSDVLNVYSSANVGIDNAASDQQAFATSDATKTSPLIAFAATDPIMGTLLGIDVLTDGASYTSDSGTVYSPEPSAAFGVSAIVIAAMFHRRRRNQAIRVAR